MSVSIPFTQFLPPNGARKLIYISVDEEIGVLAKAILDRGLVFEAELLVTGEVSLTIADPLEDVDLDIRLVPNGPAVPAAVIDLIRGFVPPPEETLQ